MERYGDDEQRRMWTEDHVPSGRAGLGGVANHGGWTNDTAIPDRYINTSPCSAREPSRLFLNVY